MCILGEPTEQRVVLGHYGTMWARISTRGPFIHTAFTAGRLAENAIVRMRDVLDDVLAWIPRVGARARPTAASTASSTSARCAPASPWRVSRTPDRADLFLDIRVPPTMPMNEAARRASPSWCASCASATPTPASSSEVLRHRARRARSTRPTR